VESGFYSDLGKERTGDGGLQASGLYSALGQSTGNEFAFDDFTPFCNFGPAQVMALRAKEELLPMVIDATVTGAMIVPRTVRLVEDDGAGKVTRMRRGSNLDSIPLWDSGTLAIRLCKKIKMKPTRPCQPKNSHPLFVISGRTVREKAGRVKEVLPTVIGATVTGAIIAKSIVRLREVAGAFNNKAPMVTIS
jgi:hypothetical protein